jgi:magnesium transporter
MNEKVKIFFMGNKMQKCYRLHENKITGCDSAEALIQLYIDPTPDEKNELVNNIHIDNHNLNSSLDPDEVSRLEFEEDHMAIILKRPRNYSAMDNLLFKITSIGIFVFKEKIVIVMPEEIQIFEQDSKHSLKLRTNTDVLLKIIYGTISHFLWHLKIINQISEALEQKINTSMENKYLLNMFTLEKSLVYYLNGITYNSMLFEKLKNNAAKIGLNTEELELLDDIIIENNQCSKQATIYTEILSSLMDARASIVNNNLSLLIKRLTIISIVFLPITFIASVGGMSEFSLATKGIPWWISYSAFSFIMGIIALGTYFFVRNIGYEKRSKPRQEKKPKKNNPI